MKHRNNTRSSARSQKGGYLPVKEASSLESRGFSVVMVVVVTTVPLGITVRCVSIRRRGDIASLPGEALSAAIC